EGEDAKNLFLRDQWHAKVGDEAVSSVEVLVLDAGIALDIGDQKRRLALEDHLGETPSRPPAIPDPVRLVDIPGGETLQRPGCYVPRGTAWSRREPLRDSSPSRPVGEMALVKASIGWPSNCLSELPNSWQAAGLTTRTMPSRSKTSSASAMASMIPLAA